MNSKILVVEDDIDIGILLKGLLEFDGYCVELAENGSQALEHLKSGSRPSVILLDLMMPVMDGFSFLDCREHDHAMRAIPVIVTSAFPIDEHNVKNVQGLMSKPINFARLRRMIADLIQSNEHKGRSHDAP